MFLFRHTILHALVRRYRTGDMAWAWHNRNATRSLSQSPAPSDAFPPEPWRQWSNVSADTIDRSGAGRELERRQGVNIAWLPALWMLQFIKLPLPTCPPVRPVNILQSTSHVVSALYVLDFTRIWQSELDDTSTTCARFYLLSSLQLVARRPSRKAVSSTIQHYRSMVLGLEVHVSTDFHTRSLGRS